MATDCDILREIFTFYNIKPYWTGDKDCLEAKGENEGFRIVHPDASKQYIEQL